jgi:Tol biopolymer transport system component
MTATPDRPWYLTPGTICNNQSPAAIVVIRSSDGTVRRISDSTSGNQTPQWSPDGKWLYYLSNRDGLTDLYAQRIADDGAMRGGLARLTTGFNAHSVTLSADGTRLAYAVLTESANVWSLPVEGAVAATAEQVTTGQQVIENLDVSRDGSCLYYDADLAGTGDSYRMQLNAGPPQRLPSDPRDEFGPAPSPDGREVAFHSFRSGNRDIYSLPLDGRTGDRCGSKVSCRSVRAATTSHGVAPVAPCS